jgi:hypothetical protein
MNNAFRISFTTPSDRCAALVEQAKALYSEFLGAQDRGDPAYIVFRQTYHKKQR